MLLQASRLKIKKSISIMFPLTGTIYPPIRPGVSITGYNFITDENGGSVSFEIKLNTAPVDPVTIIFSLSDTSEASLSATSFTFTSKN